MPYLLRFLIVTLVRVLVVIGKSFFRRTIAVSLCAIFSFNSLTWGSLLLETRGANAALLSPNVNPEIMLIRKPPSKGSHEVIEKDEKTAICLPIVGCIDTPAPDVLERPLEGAIKGEVYNALAKVLDEEAPITSSAKAIFPTVATLPGETFNADGNASKLAEKLILLPDGSTILPVGDYSIPLDVFCMKHSASSPNGHRYLLAPLQGSMSAVISALNARSVGYGVPRSQLQVLSWNIQAGMKFEDMTRENQQIIDALLPDYKEKLSVSFLEKLEATYNQFAPLVGGLPSSLDSASGRLGDIGETIRTLKGLQGTLRQYGNDYDGLSRLLVSPSSPENGGYQKGGPANTPWSKISDRVYGRLVTEGSFSSPAELQLRVLPSRDSAELQLSFLPASYSTELSQGVLVAEGKSNVSKAYLVAQNPCLPISQSPPVRLNITNLVGDPQSSGIQPLSMAPQLISLILDLSPLGEAKGLLEFLLGQDLITGQELSNWDRFLGLIPGGRSAGKISRTANSIHDAETLLRASKSGSLRSRFMKEMDTLIDKNSPLNFLKDPETGKWSGRTHLTSKPTVQAGHLTSRHSGEAERFALEDSFFNQLSNWKGESQGAIFEKEAIDIGGVPVERRTAQTWENTGLLPKGTVQAAPNHPGWVKCTP
jgi:Bacterial toxin 5/Pre-toxin TG